MCIQQSLCYIERMRLPNSMDTLKWKISSSPNPIMRMYVCTILHCGCCLSIYFGFLLVWTPTSNTYWMRFYYIRIPIHQQQSVSATSSARREILKFCLFWVFGNCIGNVLLPVASHGVRVYPIFHIFVRITIGLCQYFFFH